MTRGVRCSVSWQDLYRYGDGSSRKAFLKHFFSTPGFRFTVLLRVVKATKSWPKLLLPVHYLFRFFLYRCSVRYGIGIPYNTRIGPGLYIGHFGGIVVHGNAVLGRDCNISHGVTIGATYGGKNPGVPTIGDRVYLAPGCKVLGGIHLGDDVAVGANAVIVQTVPNTAVVGGVPGRIISYKGSAAYVGNTQGDRACRQA